MKKILYVVFILVGGCLACTKPKEGNMYYYDWIEVGIKAPSVLPESEHDRKALEIKEIRQVSPPVTSPPVLAPYNVTMEFDTEIVGVMGGETVQIQTSSKLLGGLPIKKGSRVELAVGKKNPQHVFKILPTK